MTSTIQTGQTYAWLSRDRRGRALIGRAIDATSDAANAWVVMEVTSYEDRRDRKLIGRRFFVPAECLQPV